MATPTESELLAALTAGVRDLCESSRAAGKSLDELRSEIRRLGEIVEPVVSADKARAATGARLFGALQKLTLQTALANALIILGLSLSAPIFVGGLVLAIRDPHELFSVVATLVDALPGVEVHPPQIPASPAPSEATP